MIEIAELFGNSLDSDDFESTRSLLSGHCEYSFQGKTFTGPDEIVQSYHTNMIEGRKKLDELRWGKSRVEQISDGQFYVHFTDHLRHKGVEHIFRCKQKLQIKDHLIIRIEHIEDEGESEALKAYYRKVGIGK